jgi:hypothetical protein
MKQSVLGLLVAGALAAGACATSSDPSGGSSTPAAPTPALVTENFTGSVAVGQSDTHPFTVTASNLAINVTLTAAGPPPTIFMGLGVGAQSGTTCQLLSGGYAIVQAGTSAQLSGTITSGAYCVVVQDAGNMTAPITYAVTVTHY